VANNEGKRLNGGGNVARRGRWVGIAGICCCSSRIVLMNMRGAPLRAARRACAAARRAAQRSSRLFARSLHFYARTLRALRQTSIRRRQAAVGVTRSA
jgi:hypothetical protein